MTNSRNITELSDRCRLEYILERMETNKAVPVNVQQERAGRLHQILVGPEGTELRAEFSSRIELALVRSSIPKPRGLRF